MIKPTMTTGSRPYLIVFDPSKPNRMPPLTSPTPIKMPDRPTSCFADSPMDNVNPMLELYTPLKNDSSKPAWMEVGFNKK